MWGRGCNQWTRYGEILPLWPNFQSLGQFFEGLFTICENFGPTLAKLWKPLGKFSLSECWKNLAIWSHWCNKNVPMVGWSFGRTTSCETKKPQKEIFHSLLENDISKNHFFVSIWNRLFKVSRGERRKNGRMVEVGFHELGLWKNVQQVLKYFKYLRNG